MPWCESEVEVTGDLTIRGVTKPVTVDFELTSVQNDPTGALPVGFTGTTTINRKDWRVHWNPAAGMVASRGDPAVLIQRKQPCLFTRQYSEGRARRARVIRRPKATGSNPMRERQGHS
ncbi:YceI family protein [Nocardia sp. NPDC004750]